MRLAIAWRIRHLVGQRSRTSEWKAGWPRRPPRGRATRPPRVHWLEGTVMLGSSRRLSRMVVLFLLLAAGLACDRSTARAGVTSEEVEQAIRQGIRFLKERQRGDGSWPDAAPNAPTGCSSLATLALLTAGEKPDSPVIQQALTFLRARPEAAQQHLCDRASDHGFRRRRTGIGSHANGRQRAMARASPTQGSSRVLARKLELY